MTFETKDSGARQAHAGGMVRDTTSGKLDWSLILRGPLLRRWAELLDRGAAKYGKHNWCKAVDAPAGEEREKTRARFLESAFRHFMQWVAGERDEDHAAAVIFNMNGWEAMREHDEHAAVPEHIDHRSARVVRHMEARDRAEEHWVKKELELRQREAERAVDVEKGPMFDTSDVELRCLNCHWPRTPGVPCQNCRSHGGVQL